MSNLGEQLKKNIKATADAEAAAARKKTDKEQRERQQKCDAVAKFFVYAKNHIISGITDGKSGSKLDVLLGRTPSKDHYTEAEAILRYAGIGLSTALGEPGKECVEIAAPYWSEFQAWANRAGLKLSWEYAWDDGGRHGWSVLRVHPQD